MQQQTERLERDLLRLSAATRYPPAPDLARAVRERLVAPVPRARAQWQLAAAALVPVLLLIIGLIAAVAPAREAVADLFGRINIFETSENRAAFTTQITGDEVTLPGAAFELGQAVLLPSYPAGLLPERILFQHYGTTKAAALFFAPPDGRPFVLFEIAGISAKGLPLDGQHSVQLVDGVGDQAYWLTGERIVEYRDLNGDEFPASRRATDANALVWQAGERVFRIEGDLSQGEAVRIAQSLR